LGARGDGEISGELIIEIGVAGRGGGKFVDQDGVVEIDCAVAVVSDLLKAFSPSGVEA